MKTKLIIQAAVAAATISAFGSAHALRVDTDGPGGANGVIDINGIDPAPGNAIATCEMCIDDNQNPVNSAVGPGSGTVGSILNTYGHSAIGGFTDDQGQGVFAGLYGGTHNWTLSFGFQEQIITDTQLGLPTVQTALAVIASDPTTNWFEIYYDTSLDNNMLSGQGFDNGTLILSGTILPAPIPLQGETGVTDFTASAANPGLLDSFNADDYNGLQSITGNGGGQIEIQVDFQDFGFILDPITSLTLDVSTQFIDPFSQTQPSACFDDNPGTQGADFQGAGLNSNGETDCNGTALVAGGSVGPLNGGSGPNIMFQTDANIAVPTVVPEPTTLALLGLGLAGMGARRKAKVA